MSTLHPNQPSTVPSGATSTTSISSNGLELIAEKTRTREQEQDLENAGAGLALGGERKITGFRWFMLVGSILSSIFLYALDNTIVADILPTIVNEFDDINNLGWLSVGFMIGAVAMIMPLGKAYGLFDAKWIYIISLVVFEAASALCGGAPNMAAMIVGRVFGGAGGVGMYLGVLTLLSVTTTETERPMYIGSTGLIWGIGTVLGPVVGGGFEKWIWRWAFYINLFIGALFAPAYLFILPSFQPAPGRSFWDRAKSLDWVGTILSIGAIISIVMPINFGGGKYAWNSGQTIALFVVSGLLWIAFFFQQGFQFMTNARDRMFPMHFFKNKEAVLLFLIASCVNACAFTPVYYVPIYFQFTRGDDALQSAVRLLPLIFLLSALVLTNGFLMSKWGYYQPWYVVGSAIMLVGTVLMSRINEHTSTGAIYGYEILIGIGGGAFVQAGYAIIQTVVEASELSYAITWMMIAQVGGITMGLSMSGAIFINEAKSALKVILPGFADAEIDSAISGTSSALFNRLSPQLREAALQAVIEQMRKVYIPAYVGAALALILSLFLSRKKVFVPVAAGG